MLGSIKIMQIYRAYLETTGTLIELLEEHCKLISENSFMSDTLKNKYKEFRKHSQYMINELNTTLHDLLRIDHELKEIEDMGKREKK